jgi:hypothetical protein
MGRRHRETDAQRVAKEEKAVEEKEDDDNSMLELERVQAQLMSPDAFRAEAEVGLGPLAQALQAAVVQGPPIVDRLGRQHDPFHIPVIPVAVLLIKLESKVDEAGEWPPFDVYLSGYVDENGVRLSPENALALPDVARVVERGRLLRAARAR